MNCVNKDLGRVSKLLTLFLSDESCFGRPVDGKTLVLRIDHPAHISTPYFAKFLFRFSAYRVSKNVSLEFVFFRVASPYFFMGRFGKLLPTYQTARCHNAGNHSPDFHLCWNGRFNFSWSWKSELEPWAALWDLVVVFVWRIRRLLITVASRCKAWSVFALSNAGIVGSNATQGMIVSVHLFWVCAVLCR
jgi:hypothetical protein